VDDVVIKPKALNVLGGPLECCCTDPMTGFYRDGSCHSGDDDAGMHTVCVCVSESCLEFSRARGNDLSTPVPAYAFPGLSPGDRWCLCAGRWKEAFDAGVAPQVILESTHAKTLRVVRLEDLMAHAVDALVPYPR
jgi:uncharacterized protein (DUF2237 family)